jgi:hypothetical protein
VSDIPDLYSLVLICSIAILGVMKPPFVNLPVSTTTELYQSFMQTRGYVDVGPTCPHAVTPFAVAITSNYKQSLYSTDMNFDSHSSQKISAYTSNTKFHSDLFSGFVDETYIKTDRRSTPNYTFTLHNFKQIKQRSYKIKNYFITCSQHTENYTTVLWVKKVTEDFKSLLLKCLLVMS